MLADGLISIACAAMLMVGRPFGRRTHPTAGVKGLPMALALGALVVWPALLWGALGSPWDAALGFFAGMGLGLLCGQLLGTYMLGPLLAAAVQQGKLTRAERTMAVLGTGTTLFILAGSFGFRGSQLLLLIALPPLSVAIVAIAERLMADDQNRHTGVHTREMPTS